MNRTINEPECGYWRVRLEPRSKLWLPARIHRPCQCTVNGPQEHEWQDTCDRHPPMIADINGERCELLDVWHRNGEEITASEYDEMINPWS